MYIIKLDGIRNERQTLYAREVEHLEDFDDAMEIQYSVFDGMKVIIIGNLDDLEDLGIVNPIEIMNT